LYDELALVWSHGHSPAVLYIEGPEEVVTELACSSQRGRGIRRVADEMPKRASGPGEESVHGSVSERASGRHALRGRHPPPSPPKEGISSPAITHARPALAQPGFPHAIMYCEPIASACLKDFTLRSVSISHRRSPIPSPLARNKKKATYPIHVVQLWKLNLTPLGFGSNSNSPLP
jgi:hypothetical protein